MTRDGLADPAAYRQGLGELARLGVTWTSAPVVRRNLAASLDAAAAFREEVTARRS